MKKKLPWIIIFILSLICVVMGTVFLTMQLMSGKQDYSEYKIEETSFAQEVSSEVSSKKPIINFQKLQKKNPDIYAWIKIPGTKIDYAICEAGKGRDDSFYLSHDIFGNYEFAGSIYSEKQNARDFSDPVTVLYGHNMNNGSMFAGLHKFKDENFFKKHDKFYIYTPDGTLTYKIYAAYEYDNRHILNSFDFEDKEVVDSYFQSTLSPVSMESNIRESVSLTTEDHILTLSTCVNTNSSLRYLVQGVLIKDERTK
ncbi:MAG: class B sortase [Lachnospiraceae bacterium]|nr:class B sortase [Lachnospiraceae bacterium]